MKIGLGNDMLFGALRGLRVVESPRSGGPLRRVDRVDGAPAPTKSPQARALPRTQERVTISAEAWRLSRES